MTQLLKTIAELNAWKAEASGSKVVLVPTMGALHAGHLSLVQKAREIAGSEGRVIVSNFVNPLQFGPNEDFDKYPRTLEADLVLVDTVADAMFAPSVEEMYPIYPPLIVDTGELGTVFEGAARPGHFNGVATVVLKLFNLVRPQVAIFGQKDAQQLAILRRLNEDFNTQIEIIGVPIVREETGLARSSRNEYFTPEQRKDALALAGLLQQAAQEDSLRGLQMLLAEYESGAHDSEAVQWDYAQAVDPQTLGAVKAEPGVEVEVLVLLAAKVHGVRLIDNQLFKVANT